MQESPEARTELQTVVKAETEPKSSVLQEQFMFCLFVG